jgi:hypothetical protein
MAVIKADKGLQRFHSYALQTEDHTNQDANCVITVPASGNITTAAYSNQGVCCLDVNITSASPNLAVTFEFGTVRDDSQHATNWIAVAALAQTVTTTGATRIFLNDKGAFPPVPYFRVKIANSVAAAATVELTYSYQIEKGS